MVTRAADLSARLDAVWEVLAQISDPEIPTISLVELGVIRDVRFESLPDAGERLIVELLPTFVGCPAIDIMREQVGERLRAEQAAAEVGVEISFAEPWTSERITPEGREKLRASGFAPPVTIGSAFESDDLLAILPVATCPYCGSRNTTLENAFGPTLCRAIYHCADCRQPFEQFKTV